MRSAFTLAVALIACTPGPQQPSADAQRSLEQFSWLTGCWLSRDGTVQRWDPPLEAEMQGVNLLPHQDGSQVSEALRIAVLEDGAIVYFAHMGEMPEIAYPLVRSAEGEAVFESPDNETLKRIAYRRDGEALLAIVYDRIEADSPGWQTRFTPCAS
jgi:hypothetical protein